MLPTKLLAPPSTRIKLRSSAQRDHIAAAAGAPTIGMPMQLSGDSAVSPHLQAGAIYDAAAGGAAPPALGAAAVAGGLLTEGSAAEAAAVLPDTPTADALQPLQLVFRDPASTPVRPSHDPRRVSHGSAPASVGSYSSSPGSAIISSPSLHSTPATTPMRMRGAHSSENAVPHASPGSSSAMTGSADSSATPAMAARRGLSAITNHTHEHEHAASCPPRMRSASRAASPEHSPMVPTPLWHLGVFEDRWY